MATPWIEQDEVKDKLAAFFQDNKADLNAFGLTVNQTFEAFVFASTINWYRERNWNVELVHPSNQKGERAVRLKFSTLGKPSNYTYADCKKDDQHIHVRHGLRVATRHHDQQSGLNANICLDVSVSEATDLSSYSTWDHLDNIKLVTFGEAKHMSAFAELVAGFIGLVHEMKPDVLAPIRPYIGPLPDREHPAPFLYVSGWVLPTARGIIDSTRRRGFDIDVYDHDSTYLSTMRLLTKPRREKKRGLKHSVQPSATKKGSAKPPAKRAQGRFKKSSLNAEAEL